MIVLGWVGLGNKWWIVVVLRKVEEIILEFNIHLIDDDICLFEGFGDTRLVDGSGVLVGEGWDTIMMVGSHLL